jgi:flagellar motor switch protein FliN/FliY
MAGIKIPEPDSDLARFYDVPIELSVELDRRLMKVHEILGLRAGAVLKMNRSAGDNMKLLLAGVEAGYGEIVVIEEAIGFRITEITPEPK